jgi:hypothetical protein
LKIQLSDQVRQLLRLVASNADLVCEGIEGPVLAGDAKRNARIEVLVGVGALRVEDEQTFRLNPRLKAFVEDHLGSFQAFRSLTRIDSTIRHADRLWMEVKALNREGEGADALRVEVELGEVLAEIAYDIERNLLVLNSNVSTEYGNVDSLRAKLRQNSFFLAEVRSMSASVEKLGVTADRIFDECMQFGLTSVSQVVRRNITSKLLGWAQQINEAQHTISRRLFLARKLEERLSRLSRIALWLRQRSGLGGDREFDIDANFNPLLLRPKPVPITVHVDVQDSESQVQEALATIAAALPPKSDAHQSVAPSEPLEAFVEEEGIVVLEALAPHDKALVDLVDHARMTPRPVSLVDWKRGLDQLQYLSDEEWLLYASTHVAAEGLALSYLFMPPTGAALNDRFFDALVTR